MPRLKMDLSEVSAGRPNIPPGQYVCELVDCQEGESSTGNPVLIWEWEIKEGDYNGFTLRSWTSLQDHALFGLKGHLQGLDAEADDVDMDTDELIGRMVLITVQTRKFKDRDSGEEREAASVARVEKYRKPKKKKAKKPKKSEEDDDEDDDDVPF